MYIKTKNRLKLLEKITFRKHQSPQNTYETKLYNFKKAVTKSNGKNWQFFEGRQWKVKDEVINTNPWQMIKNLKDNTPKEKQA